MLEGKEMNDLVSIIVPIYKVQTYLKECVESILMQSYTHLEIILVDDGSPDDCGKICDEYKEKDNRIKVIHKENGGLSDARNAGVHIATGKYIAFIDADDMVHPNYIEALVQLSYMKEADIVVTGFKVFQNIKQCEINEISEGVMNEAITLTQKHLYNDEFIKKEETCLTVAWGKLYKMNIWKGITFPVGKIHEDTFTTYKLMEKANKVIYLKQPLYFWRNNPESITRGKFTLNHLLGMDAYQEQLEYFYEKRKQRHIEIVFEAYRGWFFWCYNRMNENGMDLEPLIPYFKYMRKRIGYLKYTKSLGFKRWLQYRYLVYYKIPKLLKF